MSALLFILLFLVLSSSCINDEKLNIQSTEVCLSFSAMTDVSAQSRASLDECYSYIWETGDKLGVFIDNPVTPTINFQGTASVSADKVVYKAIVNDYSAGDKLYAYFPYEEGAEREDCKVKLRIPVHQNQKKVGVLNGSNFPMVAIPYTFLSSSGNEEPCLSFKHLAAFVEFDIYAAENCFLGEKVNSVKIESTSIIAGAFQFDYTDVGNDPKFTIVDEGSSSAITVSLDTPAIISSSKGVCKIYFAVKPGCHQANVKVFTDKGTYLFHISEEIGSFERAYIRRFALGLRKENQIFKSPITEFKGNYIGTQTNTNHGVYFDLETASSYGASDAVSSEVRKNTDLVLFYSSTAGICLAAPACSDLSNFKNGGIIDCNGWSAEDKNKTKIQLLSDFDEEDYDSLTQSEINSLTEGWENINNAAYHRQNGITQGSYYAFKTVRMDASANVKEVVSSGVIRISEVSTSSAASRCVGFDYKLSQTTSTLNTPVSVSVSGKKILLDGSEFVIKGVASNNIEGDEVSIGANAVRIYNIHTENMSRLGYILDVAWQKGLKVCVGLYMFPWNQGGNHNFYNDNYSGTVEKLRTHIKNVVGTYKNHPAVLMWCIGNECDASYGESENLDNEHHIWNVINEFAQIIKEMDGNHLVTTCLANAANVSYVRRFCDDLDLLMVNSYGSAIAKLGSTLSLWTKPFVVGEFAHQGTWSMPAERKLPWVTSGGRNALIELTSTQKAGDYAAAWKNVVSSGSAGGFAFHWGVQTHGEVLTWFGIHDKDGNAFGAVDELQKLWKGEYPFEMAPVIADRTKMKMNGMIADDAVRVSAMQDCTASVDASSPNCADLSYEWIIVEENTAGADGSFPDGIDGLIVNPYCSSISFSAPSLSGAYRLYVFVSDKSAGKVASACIPFYVTK